MVTSSMSGEGKSFVSLNMANSMAISGKKVVVMEFDLRKPMLSTRLNATPTPGISSYLALDNINVEDIISPVESYENLYLVNAGPLPPNPGELILSERMETMFSYLREHFDYV